MKLELDLNSSQNSTLINQSENDLGAEDVKKMLRSGISFAKEGNRVEARQMLLGVTEVEPDNETAWLWLASISEYPEELLVFLQNVLKVNPNNERALEWAKQTKSLLSKTFVQRGINAAQNNQKEFAKQCFLQGIVHDGENEMAWLWLASMSESQEEKVSHLHQVLRINPDNETALSSLNAVRGQQSHGLLKKANSAAISGDHETARQTLNAIMKQSPNLEEAWILKAFLTTDFYEKVECYERALEINSECEAAQAGLDSLQLLMPKMPKPAVEEVKAEDVSIIEEQVKEEVVEEFTQEVAQENAEFDENFDLEQLAEESHPEFTQEQPQPESRAFAEEIFHERQNEEESIHETQTGFKEDFAETPAQQTRVESIFNYDEVISQEEALAEESQAESVLEFNELSDNPTQELDEDFANNAAASFGLSAEEETVLETEAKTKVELEDFYSEQVSEEVQQDFVAEKSPSGSLKAEVRVTETYVTEVEASEIYDSEFFGNNGFVLVPQNDPFADHTHETVEFSYSEAEGVSEVQEVGEVSEVAETQEEVVEQVAQPEQPEEEAQVLEHRETAQFEEVEPAVETAEAEQSEEVVEAASAEQNEEVFETQAAEQSEETAETLFVGAAEEVEPAAEMQQFEQVEETQEFEQTEEVAEVQSLEPAEEVEQVAAAEEIVEAEQVEQTEQFAGESEEAAQFEQIEPVAEESFEVEEVEQKEEYAQLVSEMESLGSQTNLTQCPFCAAENKNQAVVCHSCQAMLSLADMEALISHQGVNQDSLLQAIERMEVEKSLRDFNAEELTFLAIANLNAKNLEKGLGYLQDAAALNPNDIVLQSKIKFLMAHLEELKDIRFRNAENPAGNKTILVVDDSPTVRKLISGKLEKCGHSVLSAVDGMDALAKINEVIPDLILLDITMPRLDGYQVCKLIRNNEMTKDVPIVMISGKDGFFDKVRGRMAGSSGYITKPFGPDTLMKTIETYLG